MRELSRIDIEMLDRCLQALTRIFGIRRSRLEKILFPRYATPEFPSRRAHVRRKDHPSDLVAK
jgi:hypothetical protein